MLNFQGVLFFAYIPYIAICRAPLASSNAIFQNLPRQATCEVQALRERCEMLEADLKSCWVKSRCRFLLMLLLMPVMLILMDKGWILLGICKKQCLLLPISNQFPTSDDGLNFVCFFCICFSAVLSILLMEEIPNNHLLDVF